MNLKPLVFCAMAACSCIAITARASEERREERAVLDLEKEKIDRAELRAAVDKEVLVVGAEHKAVLLELRESIKEEKFDHVAALRKLNEHHAELIEHLIRHIHEAREAKR